MFAICQMIDGTPDWLKSDKGEIVIFESRQKAKDQLKLMGLKRRNFLIALTDSDDLATFLRTTCLSITMNIMVKCQSSNALWIEIQIIC